MTSFLTQIELFLADHPFAELAMVVVVVAFMSYAIKALKQPLIIGYILSGIILWPRLLGWIHDAEQLELFAHIGVALLLFMVGIWLNPKLIKELGKASLVVGCGQAIFTTVIGVGLVALFGYTWTESIFIALALAFSSTIIIIKLLSDKWALETTYGKISVGMLIVQDLIAMIVLMLLSSIPQWTTELIRSTFLWTLLLKTVIIALITFLMMQYLLPKLLSKIAKSQEYLLVFSLARCLLYAAGLEAMGFSLEVGALLAGVSLASSPYRFEISNKVKHLRDFFIMVFFVFLGSQLQFGNISQYFWHIVAFSLFILIGNPLIVMILMGLMGYKKKEGMMVGFTVAQISEFSFIVIGMAFAMGYLQDPNIISMITLVGLVTILGSSYYFIYSDWIYSKLHQHLSLFEWKKCRSKKQGLSSSPQTPFDLIIIGIPDLKSQLFNYLLKNKIKVLVIDSHPEQWLAVQEKGIAFRYADPSDPNTFDELQIEKTQLMISLLTDPLVNSTLITLLSQQEWKTKLILTTQNQQEADLLTQQTPHTIINLETLGNNYTTTLIQEHFADPRKKQKVDLKA